MNKAILFISILGLLVACNTPKKESSEQKQTVQPVRELPNYPLLLQKALDAHGGINTWKSFPTLEYDMQKPNFKEHQLIDLYTRNVRLSRDSITIGFDGTDVWITPSKQAFGKGSIRFYHNLYFYFFAFPFILADEGIIYSVEEDFSLDGKTYEVLSISYGDGVGDSPEDQYICYFNKETYQLEFIRYTVTYFSQTKSDRFNALKYSDWKEVNGLLVPQVLTSYKWEGNGFGEKKGETIFENIQFSKEKPGNQLFVKPANAEVDEFLSEN